jgi:hypothetical protein
MYYIILYIYVLYRKKSLRLYVILYILDSFYTVYIFVMDYESLVYKQNLTLVSKRQSTPI